MVITMDPLARVLALSVLAWPARLAKLTQSD